MNYDEKMRIKENNFDCILTVIIPMRSLFVTIFRKGAGS